MSLLKDLQGLNAAYAEMQQKEAYTVTAADKKGNTPAYQGYKAGKKNVKTGEPMYKAADHLKKEDRESKLWNEVAKMLTELHELRGVQYKVVPLEEKKAAKDYDGDGKIESGKDEYFGSKDKAIKKAMGKKVKEDADSYVEAYVTELNKATMGSYVKKASKDLSDRRFDQGDSEKRKYEPDAADDKEEKKLVQREKGISRAATKLSKEEVSDETKKLIESGKFTQEEIDAIAEADRLGKLEESEKVAQGAYKRAQELGAKRRSKQGVNRGIGKNERAGYNLSQAARSRNASLETQGGNQTGGGSKSFGYAKNKSNPVKSKSTGDTGATGHYKKRDEKVTSKSGKTTRYKLKFADRMNAPVSRRQELKDPKKNPKHTANK